MLTVTGRNGAVLDTVDLVDGVLTYSTQKANALVEAPRQMHPEYTDADLYAHAAGTSNGYVTISADQ